MAVTKSGMVTPGQVTSVTVNTNGGKLAILNRTRLIGVNTYSLMWARLDGVDPVALGEDSYPVFAYRVFDVPSGVTTIKLICDNYADYTVEGS